MITYTIDNQIKNIIINLYKTENENRYFIGNIVLTNINNNTLCIEKFNILGRYKNSKYLYDVWSSIKIYLINEYNINNIIVNTIAKKERSIYKKLGFEYSDNIYGKNMLMVSNVKKNKNIYYNYLDRLFAKKVLVEIIKSKL